MPFLANTENEFGAIIKNNGTIQHHHTNFSINSTDYDGVVDALLGFSLDSPARPHYAELIQALNTSQIPILSIDIPSGLNANTGIPYPPTIHAHTTLTLGFPKKGFLNKDSHSYVGNIYLVDIGLPKALYETVSTQTPFQENIEAHFSGKQKPAGIPLQP